MAEDFKPYLESTKVVDWTHPRVKAKAGQLADGCRDDLEKARWIFEWTRDEIKHSADFALNPVTCSASEVLEYGTGFCYAKSHLMVAMLRANGIPAGFCYQRLRLEGPDPAFGLHGYGAVYLPDFGWYRLDPRGNKPGVSTPFSPPVERLAFPAYQEGEWNDPKIRPEPLPIVIAALRRALTWDRLLKNLPDAQDPA
jgi:transglutaminase-like putative cysteine protease